MKKCFIFCLLIFLSYPIFAVDHGRIDIVNNVRVLKLWGTHEEMGFAQGYLLGEDIMKLVREYLMLLVTPSEYENIILPIYRSWMRVPDRYAMEMDGIIAGMTAAGTDLYVSGLQRDITAEDLGVVNSIVDLWHFAFKGDLACSSISGFGIGTSTDPTIPSGTIHCRDMDWGDTTDYLLGKSSLIIAYSPSVPDEQQWFAVTLPGLIGCLSGMNSQGIGATLDMGNHDVNPGSTSDQVPILLQIRSALEDVDPNGDGYANVEDVYFRIHSQSRVPSTIIHCFGPALSADALDPPVLVIESNYTGIAKRLPIDDMVIAPWFLAATNHHRVLYPPVYCSRYETIQNMVSEDMRIDCTEAWNIEAAVSWSGTIQTMLFRPDILDVQVAFTTNPTPAPYKTPDHVGWEDMFSTSPLPTATPTVIENTPTPTATPTPPPTPTSVSSCTFQAHLQLNRDFFHANDAFKLDLIISTDCETVSVDQFILLDVQGNYWFWPDWTPEFAFETLERSAGNSQMSILDFIWPEGAGAMEHLIFWAASFDPGHDDIQHLIGDVSSVQFGFDS